MNKVILMGRLTRDAEMRQTASGTAVCGFSVAVRRRFKNTAGEYETDFINCTAWRQTAEFISKYFHKGDMIALAGSMQVRKWDDNGTTRYATEVIADEVYFCAGKTENKSEPADTAGFGELEAEDDDDLPF